MAFERTKPESAPFMAAERAVAVASFGCAFLSAAQIASRLAASSRPSE